MTEATIIQGRRIGARELEEISQLLASHPDWSRWRLSRTLATRWNWRNGVGQIKDMAARTLLLKLEQRGWIGLPRRRRVPANRMRQKRMSILNDVDLALRVRHYRRRRVRPSDPWKNYIVLFGAPSFSAGAFGE